GSHQPRLRRHVASDAGAAAWGDTNRSYSSATSAFANFQQEFSHAKVLHDVSAVLHFVSIGILGLFVLEVALKIVCLGRNFVREKFEIVDAVVIMISFVADIVFVKLESTEVSVMVLFLLWRIVRVINGA
uniref:Voltage-gated hydrogen channel 1 n=1 Tax=Macrostomum lignano TaxID=282301 RepID=A0A1I8I230_9PLAT